jgi:hypothetical protein
MRIWRTNKPLLGSPLSWVAGDLVASVLLPGTYNVRNDDGTILSIAADGSEQRAPAGTDDVHSQCYLTESRAQIAYAATGIVYGILVFP